MPIDSASESFTEEIEASVEQNVTSEETEIVPPEDIVENTDDDIEVTVEPTEQNQE